MSVIRGSAFAFAFLVAGSSLGAAKTPPSFSTTFPQEGVTPGSMPTLICRSGAKSVTSTYTTLYSISELALLDAIRAFEKDAKSEKVSGIFDKWRYNRDVKETVKKLEQGPWRVSVPLKFQGKGTGATFKVTLSASGASMKKVPAPAPREFKAPTTSDTNVQAMTIDIPADTIEPTRASSVVTLNLTVKVELSRDCTLPSVSAQFAPTKPTLTGK